jgi:integrase
MTIGSVRRTKEGWLADVTINGRRKVGRAATKTEALARRKELLEELLGQGPAAVATGNSFTMMEALRLSAAVRWAGTKGERTAIINAKQAVEHFGHHTQLASITAPLVENWRQLLKRDGNRPATINHKISALRAMLSDAALHGHITTIPALPKQLKEGNHRDRVIEDFERDLLCRWFVQAGQPAAADLLVFLLETAARWGEAERLKGADVDLKGARVTFWETKNGKPRTIPLTRRAIDALGPHVPAVRSHRVWPYSYLQMQRLLEKAKAGTGLEGEAITLHTCRHTCATKLASRGIALAQLMVFGGWSSLAACQRYMHLQTEALHTCIAALEDDDRRHDATGR